MTAIKVENLSKTFGRGEKKVCALDGVSLSVEPGRAYGLLGPNGAGKTTLIKILLGLRRPSGGRASILGGPIGDHRVRREVGYLPEDHRLPGYLSGARTLSIAGSLLGLDRTDVELRSRDLLGRLELDGRSGDKVRNYSKGMKQRLGLAMALIHRPRLLFLDEPTDGVDPIGRRVIREMIDAARGEGTTIFINSHLLMEVEMICDTVAILHRGKMIREGTIDELIPQTNDFLFEWAASPKGLEATLEPVDGLVEVRAEGKGHLLRFASEKGLDTAIDRLRSAGVSIRGIARRRLTLEEFFLATIEKGGGPCASS